MISPCGERDIKPPEHFYSGNGICVNKSTTKYIHIDLVKYFWSRAQCNAFASVQSDEEKFVLQKFELLNSFWRLWVNVWMYDGNSAAVDLAKSADFPWQSSTSNETAIITHLAQSFSVNKKKKEKRNKNKGTETFFSALDFVNFRLSNENDWIESSMLVCWFWFSSLHFRTILKMYNSRTHRHLLIKI